MIVDLVLTIGQNRGITIVQDWKGFSSLESYCKQFTGSSVGEVPARHTSHCPAASRDVQQGITGTPEIRVCLTWLRLTPLTVRGAETQTSGDMSHFVTDLSNDLSVAMPPDGIRILSSPGGRDFLVYSLPTSL